LSNIFSFFCTRVLFFFLSGDYDEVDGFVHGFRCFFHRSRERMPAQAILSRLILFFRLRGGRCEPSALQDTCGEVELYKRD
jgi:hypothetical protein